MRVDDQVLKSVAFIGRILHNQPKAFDGEPLGTGFFVSMASSVAGRMFHCFVTARHVVDGLKGDQPYIVINRRNAGRKVLLLGPDIRWWHHPTDSTADVAVMPFEVQPDHDIVSIGAADAFLTLANRDKYRIGVGDEIFITGLFTYAAGERRNMPIVRHGNIAMMPDEPIQLDHGFAHVYLVEARSIGGLSGSPVFVRETVTIQVKDQSGEKLAFGGYGRLQLLGLCLGHWDVDPNDKNKAFPPLGVGGVNMGIGIVVPASKILETINQPELTDMRTEVEKQEHERIRAKTT